jgi:hypothetical protein
MGTGITDFTIEACTAPCSMTAFVVAGRQDTTLTQSLSAPAISYNVIMHISVVGNLVRGTFWTVLNMEELPPPAVSPNTNDSKWLIDSLQLVRLNGQAAKAEVHFHELMQSFSPPGD